MWIFAKLFDGNEGQYWLGQRCEEHHSLRVQFPASESITQVFADCCKCSQLCKNCICRIIWLGSNQSEAAEFCSVEASGSRWVSFALWQFKVCHILTNGLVYIRQGAQRTWHHQDGWPSFSHTLPLISLIEAAPAVRTDAEEAFIYILGEDQ